MPYQQYLDTNVLEEATKRVEWIFDNYENIIVSISGGKDSTVVAHMMLKEANKRNRKIGVFFLDEEVVYDSTIEQVKYIMKMFPENTIPIWYQIEFELTNSTSVYSGGLKCWNHGQHKIWMRSKEQESIKHREWPESWEKEYTKNHKIFGFYEVLDCFQRSHNDTAHVVGLRATESPNRWRAVSKNKTKKGVYWGTDIDNGSAQLYPIFDWQFTDVWRYHYENDLKYSKIYEFQYKKGMSINEMRISSLIHEKSFQSLVDLQEFEPNTYDRIIKRTEGITVGAMYGKDSKLLKVRKLPKNYSSWKEYRNFLLENHPEPYKQIFIKRFGKHLNNEYVFRQQCKQLILNDFENNLPIRNKPDKREEKKLFWESVL